MALSPNGNTLFGVLSALANEIHGLLSCNMCSNCVIYIAPSRTGRKFLCDGLESGGMALFFGDVPDFMGC